ncbi:MAG: hypothetical protein ACUVWX_05105 [Kiritimatiellia bacterium]
MITTRAGKKTQAVVLVATIVALAAVTEGGTVKGPLLTLRKGGTGNPMLLDTSYGYGGFNPSTRSHGSLAVNPRTGIVYALDFSSSGNEVARMDPTREYEKGATSVDAGTGTTRTYTTGFHYRGRVAGGSDLGSSPMCFLGGWDPYMVTAGYTGVMVYAASGGTPTWREYIAQSTNEVLGELNEGTAASPIHTSARVTDVILQDNIGGLGGGGHWWGLEMDAYKGQFMATDGAIGPRLVSRYFMGIPPSASSFGPFKRVVVCHANATRQTEPTDTTVGTRYAYLRGRVTSDSYVSSILKPADFEALVPGVDDIGRDMAQDPRTGDLYLLSTYDDLPTATTNAYLTAIRPKIPDDSTQPMSYDVVDLNPGSEDTFLLLNTLHIDLRYACGIGFNGDGSRLYVTVHSTRGGAVQAVYALDRSEIPPKGTVIFVR